MLPDFILDNIGRSVAVLAVDPSSTVSGGSSGPVGRTVSWWAQRKIGRPPFSGISRLARPAFADLIAYDGFNYSPGGGVIRTTASTEGRTVTIHVADSGIGIAADEVDRVSTHALGCGAR